MSNYRAPAFNPLTKRVEDADYIGKRDILDIWNIDRYALHYFGIFRFTDLPGYFPQLTNRKESDKP